MKNHLYATIVAVVLGLVLTGCEVDQFAPSQLDDAGNPIVQEDSASNVDSGVAEDATNADTAVPTDAPTTDATDAGVQADAAVDASQVDAGPICAPFGYKPCPNSLKCQVNDSAGNATCTLPGPVAIGSGCNQDSDCGNDAVCETNQCRRLCQKIMQGPYGSSAWNTKGCAQCPASVFYQVSRLPSWIGICTY